VTSMDKASVQQQAATRMQISKLTLAARWVAVTNYLITKNAKRTTVWTDAELTTTVRSVALLRLTKPTEFATIVVAPLTVAVAFRK